jgi:hypothetical protein
MIHAYCLIEQLLIFFFCFETLFSGFTIAIAQSDRSRRVPSEISA